MHIFGTLSFFSVIAREGDCHIMAPTTRRKAAAAAAAEAAASKRAKKAPPASPTKQTAPVASAISDVLKREPASRSAVATSSSVASSSSPPGRAAKKSVVIADESKWRTTVFDSNAPPAHVTSFVNVDWKAEEAEAARRLAAHRAKHQALDPRDAAATAAQAFHPLAIPCVVDTASLSVAELRAELAARGLAVRGAATKDALIKRLDAFLTEFEGSRQKLAVQMETAPHSS